MPVPGVMADLFTNEALNSPNGADPVGTSLDNYLRAYQAILRSTNAKGADIASAATTNIGAATGEFVTVTGSTTITSLGTVDAGIVRTVHFSGAPLLTYNATSLILPGNKNYQVAAGDVLQFRSLGSGNWRCVGISNPANAGAVTFVDTVSDMKALTGLADGATVRTKAYRTGGNPWGGGTYKYNATPTGTADGFIYHDQTTGGGQFELLDVYPNVYQAGAYGDGVTKDTSYILAAFRAFLSDAAAIDTITTYTGSVVRFKKGKYLVDPSEFDITDIVGLKLIGEGARDFQYYKKCATSIIVDGTGTTTSDFMFRLNANNARGFSAEKISFEYNNSFAGDLFVGDSLGTCFTECSFGSTAISGVRPKTANSLVRFWEGHHYSFINCTFSDAADGIIIDNATAPNTNSWRFFGCTFYDFTNSSIKSTGVSAWGVAIVGCDFDPVEGGATYAVNISAIGLSIIGCNFAGSTLADGPTTAYINLQDGQGVIQGNMINTENGHGLLAAAGTWNISGNRFSTKNGIRATGSASISGGNNRFVHQSAGVSDIAVEFAQSSTCNVNFGPDVIGSGYDVSYKITGSATINGIVNYDVSNDSSTSKFATTSSRGSIRVNPTNAQEVTTVPATIDRTSTGTVYSFGGAGSTTLPATANLVGNLEWTFVKKSSSTVTINAGAGTSILDTSSKASIANSTAEIGAAITLKAISATQLIVVSKVGTWA